MPEPLPHRVLAWYGDDYTGSTDVLEVLALAGLEPVLFLAPPDADALAAWPRARAIGLAGVSRARDPAWMDAELPAAFASLLAAGAPLLHYKVCSTFDSSPTIGSIGRAIELGRTATTTRGATPVVVGAPALGRYTAFGHLFAAVDGLAYRIDRHPTMSRHPSTPMRESDLALHLGEQTALPVRLLDLVALKSTDHAERYCSASADDGALLIDVLDDETLERAGELLWNAAPRARFCAGSSGVEYALVAHWRATGLLDAPPPAPAARAVDRLLTVSGSCSPVTATQIEAARQAGHAVLDIDLACLVAGDDAPLDALARAAAAAWSRGASVLVPSARGPDDPSIARLRAAIERLGHPAAQAGPRIGAALGRTLARLVADLAPARVAIAGGDTSGEGARALGLRALTMIAPLAPGSPLCRADAPGSSLDGLEITLKGGQVGGPDFFEDARRGRAPASRGAAPSATRSEA